MIAVQHNLMAVNADRQFSIITRVKRASNEKLSSGYKINRASDDAAGLSISEKIRRQIRGLNQGIKNTEDGISVCQVADGALSEISTIIHRMKELSVHAANGILSEDDRKAIEDEYAELKEEIDRIGRDTEFNGIPLFCGKDIEIGPPGTTFGSIGFDQVELGFADLSLSDAPFTQGSGGYETRIATRTTPNGNVSGFEWGLIFGNGSTSTPSIRFSVLDNNGIPTNDVRIVELRNMAVSNYVANETNRTWSRMLSYNQSGVSFNITQKVTISAKKGNEQFYNLTYDIKNMGNTNIRYDFMYHCDTAYNNDDQCEGYFINGTRVSKSTLYTTDSNYLNMGNNNILGTIPNSFSICDQDNVLQFTEKIQINSNDRPDILSIGHYARIDDWDYYNRLNAQLGSNMLRNDLGFSMIWTDRVLNAGHTQSHGLKQGIAATSHDANVAGVPLKKNTKRLAYHESENPLFIQSGCNAGEGIYLTIDEMDCTILGLKASSCQTQEAAQKSVGEVDGALKIINAMRSRIGAQQNRLEYTITNETNYSENLQAAESRIRDTDMAEEMVRYSRQSILEQVGQAMMSQANQQHGSVLELLQ